MELSKTVLGYCPRCKKAGKVKIEQITTPPHCPICRQKFTVHSSKCTVKRGGRLICVCGKGLK